MRYVITATSAAPGQKMTLLNSLADFHGDVPVTRDEVEAALTRAGVRDLGWVDAYTVTGMFDDGAGEARWRFVLEHAGS